MAKEKACRDCRAVFEGAKCPSCGSTNSADSFKGKIIVLDPEQSEIAKKLKIDKKGVFSARLR